MFFFNYFIIQNRIRIFVNRPDREQDDQEHRKILSEGTNVNLYKVLWSLLVDLIDF